jgi:transcriptional regulator with GAF, ATPase, and Fis domain
VFCFHVEGRKMSRNAVALKRLRKPARRLRPLARPRGFDESPQLADRVQELKDLALTLLKETQSLERETLLFRLTSPEGPDRLDIERGIKLDDAVRRFESGIIQQALLITGGNQARAARLLGIKANTLNYKVKIYNL